MSLPAPPGAHLGLAWRPLTAADTDAVRRLALRAHAVDQALQPTATDLHPGLLTAAGVQLASDTLGGWDPDGVLRAAATLRPVGGLPREVASQLGGIRCAALTDPAWRGRGIGRALLSWQEDRCEQLVSVGGPQVLTDAAETDRRRLCVAAGLSPLAELVVLQHTGGPPSRPAGEPAGAAPVAVPVRGATAEQQRQAERLYGTRVGEQSMLTVSAGRVTGVLDGSWLPEGWPAGPCLYLQRPVTAEVQEPYAVAEALLHGALAEYAAGDMDRARLDVWTPDAGLIDTCTALGMTVRGTCVLYSIES